MNPNVEKSIRTEVRESDEMMIKSIKDIPNRAIKQIYHLGFFNEASNICRNAIPLAIGNLSQMLFTMMSLFFCGHIGTNELAAVALANTFINVGCIAPLNGMATACDTLFPKLFGGCDKKKVGVILQKGWIISILTAMPCISILLNAKNLMFFISKEEKVIRLADEFLLHYSPSAFFYSIYIVISKYLQSQNIILPVLIISVISNMINAAMQAFLVSWLKIGVKGSAWSVVFANGCQVFLLVGYILIKKVYKQTWPGWSIECLYDWKIYLKYGLGGVGMTVFEWAFFEIAVISTSVLSSTDISVMSITLQIMFLVSMVYTGIAYSGNIRIGYLLGENLPIEAINTVKVVLTLGFLTSLLISGFIFTLSSEFSLLFTNNDEVVSIANPIVKFLAISSLLDALQAYGNAVLRTVGAQSYCMIISFICYYLLGLPMAFYLLFKTNLRVLGFWMGHAAIAIILFVLQIVYIHRVDWSHKANRAHNLCLKNHHRKQTTISLAVISGSGLSKLKSVNTVSGDSHINHTEQVVIEVEAASVIQTSNTATKINLKRKLTKKGILFTLFLVIFVASYLVKDLHQIKPPVISVLNRPMFSNWTFLEASNK